ncbi:hypothetical protein [Nocardiopsis suaedae]|uniref:Uncharacterized protein n=1 Tax=Nocardiopsis suaedae TaxID=3018444 RepID=A0ABT4TQ15_9ACTN|nr:hypothetical protein [Nocardiopsis suaedae]MDA2806359.1 hypothetical protein [Nocardiopsis suaedae]
MTTTDEGTSGVREQPAPEPAGNRYRLAETAKRLSRTYADAEAALDAFEDGLPPQQAEPTQTAALLSPAPSPLPGFPAPSGGEGRNAGADRAPRRRRIGAVLPLAALLLGAVVVVSGAGLVEAVVDAPGLRPVLAPVPGLLLLVCLLGAGEHIAAGRTRWGPALLYGSVLASACALAGLWGHSVAPPGPTAVGTAVGAATLTALAGATCLAAQRRSAAAARDAHGPVAPFVDGSAVVDRVRTRRRGTRLHRLRDRARGAVHTHVRAWEDVHHECLRLADPRSESAPSVVAALNELGAVAPPGSRTPLPGEAVDFAGLGGGNTAATVRCLARYHPRDLEERLDELRRRTPAPAPEGAERVPGAEER